MKSRSNVRNPGRAFFFLAISLFDTTLTINLFVFTIHLKWNMLQCVWLCLFKEPSICMAPTWMKAFQGKEDKKGMVWIRFISVSIERHITLEFRVGVTLV